MVIESIGEIQCLRERKVKYYKYLVFHKDWTGKLLVEKEINGFTFRSK